MLKVTAIMLMAHLKMFAKVFKHSANKVGNLMYFHIGLMCSLCDHKSHFHLKTPKRGTVGSEEGEGHRNFIFLGREKKMAKHAFFHMYENLFHDKNLLRCSHYYSVANWSQQQMQENWQLSLSLTCNKMHTLYMSTDGSTDISHTLLYWTILHMT